MEACSCGRCSGACCGLVSRKWLRVSFFEGARLSAVPQIPTFVIPDHLYFVIPSGVSIIRLRMIERSRGSCFLSLFPKIFVSTPQDCSRADNPATLEMTYTVLRRAR